MFFQHGQTAQNIHTFITLLFLFLAHSRFVFITIFIFKLRNMFSKKLHLYNVVQKNFLRQNMGKWKETVTIEIKIDSLVCRFYFFVRDERNCGQQNCNIITGRYMKMLSVNLQQSNDLGSDELVTPNSGMGFPLKL